MHTLSEQRKKADLLLKLHHNNEPIVFLNISNPLEALLLESIGYKAVATASASIALTNGYKDGEKIPFEEYLHILKRIVKVVNIPVSADIESGFASSINELKENIKQLIQIGIAGINIEDTNAKTGKLFTIEEQTKRIEAIKEVASELKTNLVVNARTDMYLHLNLFVTEEEKLKESITRSLAYKKVGADCIFPILIKEESSIKTLINTLSMPINVIPLNKYLSIQKLQELGVKRISVGAGFLRIGINALKNTAQNVLVAKSIENIINNKYSSEELNNLIHK